MTGSDDQSTPDRQRVRPYAMTGGRTRPAHTDLEAGDSPELALLERVRYGLHAI